MRTNKLIAAWLLPACVAAGILAGCGDGGDDVGMTATAPAVTPTSAPDIREANLTLLPELQLFLSSAGGQIDQSAIIYADLTEDGIDDAVVPVSSGGEGGDIAVFVFAYGPAGLQELLRVLPETRLRATVSGSSLRVTEPSFAPGDPLCCPSELRTTTYQWDGSRLAVANVETSPGEN